jgi:hypothetical protein
LKIPLFRAAGVTLVAFLALTLVAAPSIDAASSFPPQLGLSGDDRAGEGSSGVSTTLFGGAPGEASCGYDDRAHRSRGCGRGSSAVLAPKAGRNFPAPSASHPRLQNAYRQRFRARDQVPGGTAGAIRAQGDHIEKGRGYVKNLDRIVNKERLSGDDFFTAIRVRNDLYDALRSRNQHRGLDDFVRNP